MQGLQGVRQAHAGSAGCAASPHNCMAATAASPPFLACHAGDELRLVSNSGSGVPKPGSGVPDFGSGVPNSGSGRCCVRRHHGSHSYEQLLCAFQYTRTSRAALDTHM
eukprot:354356-Chlamydomonas_euryale.AAC.3